MESQAVVQKQELDPAARAAVLAGAAPQRDTAFNQFVADMRDIIFSWQHFMRGEFLEEESGGWKKIQNVKNKCSEAGIQELSSHVLTIVNKNTFISNLNEEQVVRLTQDSMTVINDLMLDKGDEWELAPEYRRVVLNQLGNMIELALRRAKDAGERNYYSTVQSFFFGDGSSRGKPGVIPSLPIVGGLFGGKKR